MTATTLELPDAVVCIEELGTGKRKITVNPLHGRVFISKRACETTYPLHLIEQILAVKGPGFLCDEIMRDEAPMYMQYNLEHSILAYIDPENFRSARILDFGCGSGASTMILSRLFPGTEIVGVDLADELICIARLRTEFYGLDQVSFGVSPDASSLPDNLGEFDLVNMSAVFEHLLPNERATVLPLIWSHLKPGGILFLNGTPYRYFPIESHTTGLPLINYLPNRLVLILAHRFSKKTGPNASWDTLLRQGIRGGSVREIMGILKRTAVFPMLLEPTRLGMKDRIDLWLKLSSVTRASSAKRLMYSAFKGFKRATGVTFVPTLTLAISKPYPR